ncbi:MAG: DNA/RNA non-specific endonuclease, partial [Planctomycetota bacterium]
EIVSVQFTVRSKPTQGKDGSDATVLESLGTQMIPPEVSYDGQVFQTDVLERDYEPSFQIERSGSGSDRKKRVDPVVPGVSVSHEDGDAGTIGLVVFDRASGGECILSNWHVLQHAFGELGDMVVQPGPHDASDTRNNSVGRLLRSHLGHAGDCAIAQIENRRSVQEILGFDLAPTEIVRVDLGDVVIKSGRTTDITSGRVRRTDVIAKITYPGLGTEEVGGFEIGVLDPAAADHEISLPGDSGSAWLLADATGDEPKATEFLAGLHFAGESSTNDDEHALACYAHAVFDKLDISLTPIDEKEQTENLRTGYNPDFLTTSVPLPDLGDHADDAVPFGTGRAIPYVHYSVVFSGHHGFARLVAWNIDGATTKRVNSGGLDFKKDRRIDRELQHGDELYDHNNLDKGHLARRADLTWGSVPEAEAANKDSYFFTNCAPQHLEFNRSTSGGIWGQLENAIFRDSDIENLKVSVMAGPIFSEDDVIHRDVPVPADFWKLIAHVHDQTGELRTQAYLLTQSNLLSDIETLSLDPFSLFQIAISELESLTGLDFGGLRNADTFTSEPQREALRSEPVARRIERVADVVVRYPAVRRRR